jgi:hypothetical protein
MTARVDLAQLLVQATEFARQWRMQDGCSALVLDGLATAIEGYVGSHTGNAGERVAGVIIDDPVRDEVPASCDAHPANEVCPDCAPLIAAVMNREATAREQREALDRGLRRLNPPHVELLVLATIAGDVLVTNRSAVELEVVHDDGSSIGLPPTARGCVPSGAVVRTPPGVDWTRPRPVSDSELAFAQRHGQAAHQRGGDYLWAQRLPDGRGVFLMPWRRGGVQLSVGTFGDMTFHGTWYYDAEHVDLGWREALGWDVGQREPKRIGVQR